MHSNNSAIFILPVTSQPRYLKRIKAFSKRNFKNVIFSFERDYFKGEVSRDYISLGKMEHGNYFKRIHVLFKAFKTLYSKRKIIQEAKIIYVFGLDNLMLINFLFKILFEKKAIIYEVSDIRAIMFKNNIFSKLLKKIEKFVIRKVDLITVTSPYFISDYYIPKLKISENKFFVIENKLKSPLPPPKENIKEVNNKLVIGFFGLLRCQKSWDLLYELARKNQDKIEVYIMGYLMNLENFETRTEELSNIKYEGEYKSPDDLAEMYKKIDISLIGNVSNNTENGKLALPNRLYESLHYHVPMIAHSETAVAKRVKELDVGWILDFDNIEESINYIMKFSEEELLKKRKNTFLPESYTVGDKDHEELINYIYEKILNIK